MSMEFIIEKHRLILKCWLQKDRSDEEQREATVEEFMAFQFGVEKGKEFIALEIEERIEGIRIKTGVESPSTHPLSERGWQTRKVIDAQD